MDSSGNGREEGEMRNKFSAIELSLEKLTNRIIEMELYEAIAAETEAKLKARKKEVAEEIKKLDQLQYERWESRSDFCEKLWKFSAENDLCSLFNQYLDMPKRIRREHVVFDKNQHPYVLKARKELEELKNELISKNAINRSLEEKTMQAKIQLQIAKSYREKDKNIIRLKNDIDAHQENYFNLESKIATMELNFVELQNFSTTPVPEKKRNFITATELIAKEEINDNTKKSRFSVKKESAILRKFTRASVRRT